MGRQLLFVLWALLFGCVSGEAQEFHSSGDPFSLQITSVRSLDHDSRVGFSKAPELYAVNASGPGKSYVLYCVKTAPEAGRSYTAIDAYVSSDYSSLHLWPVEKKTLPPTVLTYGTKKGRLFRVITIQNVTSSPKPDLACDIYSETALRVVPADSMSGR